jgi:hypothetical protein
MSPVSSRGVQRRGRRASVSSKGTEADDWCLINVEEESAAQRALEVLLASHGTNKYDALAGPPEIDETGAPQRRTRIKAPVDPAVYDDLPLADVVVLHQLPPPTDDGTVGMQVIRAHYKGCVTCGRVQPVGAFVPGKHLCIDCHHTNKWRRWLHGTGDGH